MTCQSPLIHVEMNSKLQPLLYQVTLDVWADFNQWTSPNLDSTRVALHRSGEVSTRPLTRTTGAPSQSPWRAQWFHSFKPSRRRQPPTVTSRWCLLEDSLVPQSLNSWCNALGCSQSHEDATSKPSEWEKWGRRLKYFKEAFQSAKRPHPQPSMRNRALADRPPHKDRTVRRSNQ
jgi:hypothetical protein